MKPRDIALAPAAPILWVLGKDLSARVLIGGAVILVGLWIVVRVAAAPAAVAAAER